jgi:hypothetical protein
MGVDGMRRQPLQAKCLAPDLDKDIVSLYNKLRHNKVMGRELRGKGVWLIG